MHPSLEPIFDGIVSGDRESVAAGVGAALAAGLDPERILLQGLIPGMQEVGRLFEAGEYYVPEMLVSARAMKTAMADLEPLLAASGVQPRGRVVVGTVQGDLHDIGKNLVATMLGGAGFEVRDLGVDVAPERFVQAVQEQAVDVVALSALLTTTMVHMGATIDALAAAGLRGRVKVMVGGAPLSEGYARELGADGYAADAIRAARLAERWV